MCYIFVNHLWLTLGVHMLGLEQFVYYSKLFQIYNKNLSSEQYNVLESYLDDNLQISEISQNNNITRQAVHKLVNQGLKKLDMLEEKIGYLKNLNKILKSLQKLEVALDNNQTKHASLIVKQLKKEI